MSPKKEERKRRNHRNSSADFAYPFPRPGSPKKKALPATTESLWPFVDIAEIDDYQIQSRYVDSPVNVEDFKARVSEVADDVGVISIDDPAIAHERDEILYVYPHARTLISLVGAENVAAMQSRHLPSANHELYSCEERIFAMGRETIKYVESLGGAGLTTTIGWPQAVAQRWADKIWPLSHRLVAQAAGLGAVGLSRNFLHRKLGAFCLLDTVVTNIEFPDKLLDKPVPWNPCSHCNLCVAGCPTDAIKSDGEFDFFACYNHTYRDSIPGFMDLIRDLGSADSKRFEKRWSDADIAALWQSLAFRIEYRCFNCISVCPAHYEEAYHGSKDERKLAKCQVTKPLAQSRGAAEQQFVIDTPSAREKYNIAPGEWRTLADPSKPGHSGVRLVEMRRIRTSNIDSMMRLMPHYFRASEANGLNFTCEFQLTERGGDTWTMKVADNRCQVHPVKADSPDITVRCNAELFLRIHRGEANPVVSLLTGRIRLEGNKRLFLAFPAILALTPGATIWHRLTWKIERAWRRRRNAMTGKRAR